MSDPEPTRSSLLELTVDIRAVLAEVEVPLVEVLEYGVGSLIHLGSADSIEARVLVGDSEVGRGSVVALSPSTGDSEGEEPQGAGVPDPRATSERTSAPRLAVRFDEIPIDRWREALIAGATSIHSAREDGASTGPNAR